MKRTPAQPELSQFPEDFQSLLRTYPVYDSSCSAAARVWFVEGDGGLYLKAAPKGTLKTEAEMTRFFHGKGFGAEVLDYRTGETDWLLTRAIPGEDCLDARYLADPQRLCDTTALLLRQLHETDFTGCPVRNRSDLYRETAQRGYLSNRYDPDLFPGHWGFSSAKEAWGIVLSNGKYLKNDTLLHGDYCLPNILLDHWQFSGFIDVGNGGVGDKHIDLFWGLWSLNYNLKTNRYYDRFLDVYGREHVQPELLRTVAAFEVFLG